jgi:thiopeptide-type bacteriocin biosynthesis protein
VSKPANSWSDLVIESLGADDVAEWARVRSIPLEELAERRARFLAAGSQALRECEPGERWFQIESDLRTDPGGLRLLAGGLPEQVETWIEAGKVRRFSFLHKPPGLRLRFSSCAPDFREELAAYCSHWSLDEWGFGFYEPEQYQFGGVRGIDLAHDYFTVESLAVLMWRDAMVRGCANLSAVEFSLLILHHLFSGVVGGRWELWDLWCNMRLTDRLGPRDLAPLDTLEDLRREWLPFLFDPGVATPRMSPLECRVWEHYRERVAPLIPAIRDAGQSGQLLWPLRRILPFWVVFHWNRMGFDLEMQRYLARIMTSILNPKW